MLDVNDFITERGGNPEVIRESQRRRFAPVEDVDAVIALFEDHRATAYAATQVNSKINAVQKQIGPKMKVLPQPLAHLFHVAREHLLTYRRRRKTALSSLRRRPPSRKRRAISSNPQPRSRSSWSVHPVLLNPANALPNAVRLSY